MKNQKDSRAAILSLLVDCCSVFLFISGLLQKIVGEEKPLPAGQELEGGDTFLDRSSPVGNVIGSENQVAAFQPVTWMEVSQDMIGDFSRG